MLKLTKVPFLCCCCCR